jgi:hypothetical protein
MRFRYTPGVPYPTHIQRTSRLEKAHQMCTETSLTDSSDTEQLIRAEDASYRETSWFDEDFLNITIYRERVLSYT